MNNYKAVGRTPWSAADALVGLLLRRNNGGTGAARRQIVAALLAVILACNPLFAQQPQVTLQNSARIHELLRAGNLYLSLQDALALAIENNLDIELVRYLFPTSSAELLRSQGGGTLRGLNFTLAEVPTGVGGPL